MVRGFALGCPGVDIVVPCGSFAITSTGCNTALCECMLAFLFLVSRMQRYEGGSAYILQMAGIDVAERGTAIVLRCFFLLLRL